MFDFNKQLFLDEVLKEIPKLMSIKDAQRVLRTRKKYCLIVGDNVHLTNEPYILYLKRYFFTQLNKTTLIILNK